MNPNDTQTTLDLVKGAIDPTLAKSITTSTGLVAYDLQAPAKNLYPTATPIRNQIPRIGGGTGVATNWKQISAIIGSGVDTMGWVPEGQRSARMSYTAANKSASYVTLGEEDQATYEAINAGKGFEDIKGRMVMRLLQKAMLKEEMALIAGNATLQLGTPTTPTLAAAGSGATLPTLTYSVIVVALTMEGFRAASVAGGVKAAVAITGADGQSYTINGGSSMKSAAATQAVTLGQILSCSTPAINGAVGYAWYTGAAGAEKLEKITTINSVTFSAPLLGTGQAATAITADCSANPNYAFDGLITVGIKSGLGYLNMLATGTAGTGTVMTASGRGSVTEIDNMLQAMWDNYQVSPTVLYVNSQELKNISNKVLSSGSSPLLQYHIQPGDTAYELMASGIISAYFNPFALNGGVKIPIKIHPMVPAGMLFGYAENLPAQYQSNEVPNVAEVKTRADYYQIDWPIVTRAQGVGVYMEEVLAVYAPFAVGIIGNIANG
jgi:hypothetical protein